jgi:DNA-directed RNA polymerase specialized sigma24 family protein
LTGNSVAAMKSRLHRARATVRHTLTSDAGGSDG